MADVRLAIIFIAAAAAAPQDNSVTFIKALPPPEEPLAAPSFTSSHIENLPPSSQDVSDYKTDEDSKQEYLDTSADSSKDEQGTASTEDSTEVSTETTEAATERYELKTTPKFQKKAPPKFYSKLSYFEKPNFNSVVTNLVDRSGKRKFRSRCRCEKISNCPKLQITVPRCPEEYFLCCF